MIIYKTVAISKREILFIMTICNITSPTFINIRVAGYISYQVYTDDKNLYISLKDEI